MAKHTTNCYNAFIEVAPDIKKDKAEIPPVKEGKISVANIHYEMILSHPYTYTSDDVIFNTYAIKNDISNSELVSERERFFSKGQPCMRTSPLTKTYGWGVHCDGEGKLALIGMDSEEYEIYAHDGSLDHFKTMRSKKE